MNPKCVHCNLPMVTRHNRHTGEPFWGCPKYPKCKFTLDYLWDLSGWVPSAFPHPGIDPDIAFEQDGYFGAFVDPEDY